MKYFTRSLIGLLALSPSAFALDQIIHPYQSVRSLGMGGTKIASGLYEDNFFYNPARVTANPESKFTIFDFTPLDINSSAIHIISPLSHSGDTLKVVSDAAGDNLHERIEMIFPAYYMAALGDQKLALAFGLLTSVQTDVDLRASYRLNFGGFLDIGPAITAGYKLLPDDSLSIGLTTHLIYRLSTDPTYSLSSYISGTAPSLSSIVGQGAMIDFDLGSTYLVGQLLDFDITVAFAIQNILGGGYTNLGLKPAKLTASPLAQPRSLGLGVAATQAHWGPFDNTIFTLEFSDIGNNKDGSIYRLIHLGGETHWHSLILRLGINQGYLTAGLGVDCQWFTANFATYGEELELNVGEFEDRRYALNFGFHI